MATEARLSERHSLGLIAFCVASFAAWAQVALRGKSQFADLSGQFTDHLHHVYGAWLFWKHHFAVLRTPFAELSGEGFPHTLTMWAEVPWMYPLGTLALFAPVTLLAKLHPLTFRELAQAAILLVLFWSHIGYYLFARACSVCPPGLRLVLRGFAWLMMMRLAVEGFFDPLWLGAGAAVVGCASRGAHARALLWFAFAASLHYRAAVFAPAAAYALFALLRGRAPRAWPWPVLVATACSCLATLMCFWIMYPASAGHRQKYPPFSEVSGWPLFKAVVALSLVCTLYFAFRRAWVGGATMLLLAAVAVSDFRGYLAYWHHAGTLLAAPIAAGLALPEPKAQVLRAVALLYGLVLARLVWADTPLELLGVLVAKLPL